MSRPLLLALLLAPLLAPGCAARAPVPDPVPPRSAARTPARFDARGLGPGAALKAILEEGIGGARPEVVRALIGDTYTQHNPRVKDGPAGVVAFVERLSRRPESMRVSVRVLRTLEDPPFVASHSEYLWPGGKVVAGFDVFRLQDGKLVEHWDAGMPQKSEPDEEKGQRGLLEGPTEIIDREQGSENKIAIQRFVDEVLIERTGVVAEFVAEDLIQHDPRLADDPAAWAEALDAGALVHTRLERVIGEGNFVLTQCHGSLARGGAESAVVVYDLFRLEAGLIVEHWIVWEKVPDKMRHENGML